MEETPGSRGIFDTEESRSGVVRGWFVPKEALGPHTYGTEHGLTKAKVAELDPKKDELRLFPTDTRPWNDNFLGPKYPQIRKITLDVEVDELTYMEDLLATLPGGLNKNPEFGLGFAQECDIIVNLIEEHTECTSIALPASGEPAIRGRVFYLPLPHLEELRGRLARIKSRGDVGIRRVKQTMVHNELASVLGLQARELSLGRLPDSRWMTKVAAGEVPLNDDEQDRLLAATAAGARSIVESSPQKLARLQRDIELVNLDQLIVAFADALDAGHPEPWWQRFFEENVFLLQLIFGGPTVFVDSQVPIGEGDNSTKGKKIADYFFKNSMTNNAALVEIKKPSTLLLGRREYRAGVYGVDAEIGKAVTQVLDQALQLARSEAATRMRTGDPSWTVSAPRCFVVAGRASELDTPDKQKSFDLFREHLAGVRLVTFDEIFEQLKTLREFLSAERAESGESVCRS